MAHLLGFLFRGAPPDGAGGVGGAAFCSCPDGGGGFGAASPRTSTLPWTKRVYL